MADDINYDVYNDGDSGVTKPNVANTYDAKISLITTSFSHVLGNITSIIENYMIDMMPPKFFKQKRVTTEEAFKDIKNFKKNLIVAEKPYLIIDPKIIMDEEPETLPWVNWERFHVIDRDVEPNLYMMNHEFFMNDKDKLFLLGYTFNRYKFEFNMSILVDTHMLRLQVENFIRSHFRFRHFFPIKRYVEIMIPSAYIQYIADSYQMDITSEDFLRLLNKLSSFTILRLHRPATNTTEFFIMQMKNIQMKFPQYPQGSKVMSNRLEKYSIVQIPLNVEITIPNNFILLANETVTSNDMIRDYMVRVQITSKAPTIPNVLDGKSLYYKINAEFDNIQEVIDLSSFLSSDTLPLIRYITKNNLTDDYVIIKVYKWDTALDETDANIIEFDKSTYELTLKGLEKEVVYTICIYFDMYYLAKIKKYVAESISHNVNYTADDINNK